MNKSKRYIQYWLWSGVFMVVLMVIIGGITRLTGSGLSIVEWKPVTGVMPPLSEADWQVEFEKYKQFPEYQKLNYHMNIREFKQIFFWEYLHRLLGRVLGVVFIVPFLVFYAKGWINRMLMISLLLIFALGILQGFMGWYMVKSGLSSVPHVSHFRLAAHKALAVLLIMSLVWTVLSLRHGERIKPAAHDKLKVFTVGSLVILMIQILLGALVAGLKGGYSYTNFPWMGETFFPVTALVDAEQLLHNGVVLQFIHRWLAFVLMGTAFTLFFLARPYPAIRPFALRILLLVSLQIVLGICTLWFSVPVWLGVTHQLTAMLILIFLIQFLHKHFHR